MGTAAVAEVVMDTVEISVAGTLAPAACTAAGRELGMVPESQLVSVQAVAVVAEFVVGLAVGGVFAAAGTVAGEMAAGCCCCYLHTVAASPVPEPVMGLQETVP